MGGLVLRALRIWPHFEGPGGQKGPYETPIRVGFKYFFEKTPKKMLGGTPFSWYSLPRGAPIPISGGLKLGGVPHFWGVLDRF